jgi:hypothetical protein
VNANHGLVAKMFEKELNSLFRGKKGKATIKKEVKCVWKFDLQIFCCERSLKNNDV